MEKLADLAHKEDRESEAPVERLVPAVSQEIWDHQEELDPVEPEVWLENKEGKETSDVRELPDLWDSPA